MDDIRLPPKKRIKWFDCISDIEQDALEGLNLLVNYLHNKPSPDSSLSNDDTTHDFDDKVQSDDASSYSSSSSSSSVVHTKQNRSNYRRGKKSSRGGHSTEPSTEEWFDIIHDALKFHFGHEATITELVLWLGDHVDYCKCTPIDIWKRKLTNLLGHHPRRFVRRDRDKNNPKESARPGTGGFWGLSQEYENQLNQKKSQQVNERDSKSSYEKDSRSEDEEPSPDDEDTQDDTSGKFTDPILRPTLATADIIQQVLMSQKDKKGSCNEIFQWIVEKFPWFKSQPTKRWHHTVRHALSSYKDLFIHFSPKDASFKPPRGGFYGLKRFYDKEGKFVDALEDIKSELESKGELKNKEELENKGELENKVELDKGKVEITSELDIKEETEKGNLSSSSQEKMEKEESMEKEEDAIVKTIPIKEDPIQSVQQESIQKDLTSSIDVKDDVQIKEESTIDRPEHFSEDQHPQPQDVV